MTVPTDLTEELPIELSSLSTATTSSAAVPQSMKWDCSIGGLPFLFAFSDQYPFRRETASFRRDRVDTSTNPGEQSLDSGFWLRSSASWHYGSGLTSAEPLEISDTEARFRYKISGGIDPWTPGQVSLLNSVDLKLSSTGSTHYMLGVNTGVIHADGTTVTYIPSSGATSAVTWGGAAAVTSLTSDGANYYAANATGIYKGALPSGAGTLVWNTGSTSLVRWVKSRLMAAVGLSLYELTTGGPTLPTALFTHPTTGWTWTDFAEGPVAIYAAGYSGDQSVIYKIGVNTSTSTITLNQPVVVAELPRGEIVKTLYSYVGTYLCIGTSKGLRIALMAADGSLTFGPLVVESTDGVLDCVAVGSFVYVAVGSKGEAGNRVQRPGLYRVDLGTNLNQSALRFAAAPDLVAPTGVSGSATRVTTAGGRVWFTVPGTGVYRQSDTDYVTEGWVETGRIRMSTVEPKAWRDIRVIMDESSGGTVAAHATPLESGTPSTWDTVVSVSSTSSIYDAQGSLVSACPTPQTSLFVAFKLTRGSATTTPVLVGYQVRSIPAPHRSQLVQVPLMCFDHETDKQGARYGSVNGAWSRFNLLKQLEDTASTVQWKDYTTGEQAEAYIEQVQFNRKSPPSRGYAGNGGILSVTLRLV